MIESKETIVSKEKPPFGEYKLFKIYNLMITFKDGSEHKYGSFLSLEDAESCEFWVSKEGFGADNAKVKTKIETQSVRMPIIHETNPFFKRIAKEQEIAEAKRNSRGY